MGEPFLDHSEPESWEQRLARNRVIPAIKDETALRRALHSQCDILFLMYGDILSLDGLVTTIIRSGRKPFVHLDMIAGLANNTVVLDYFHRHFRRGCGVITTKSNMAKKALELGITVVQRYFMLDSFSVESAVEGIRKTRPDAIEIMPGILPRVIAHLSRQTDVPIIAGGLIQAEADVEKILASGAIATSASRCELWPGGLGHAPLPRAGD
jgi:glycerol uptake operon antiterminator